MVLARAASSAAAIPTAVAATSASIANAIGHPIRQFHQRSSNQSIDSTRQSNNALIRIKSAPNKIASSSNINLTTQHRRSFTSASSSSSTPPSVRRKPSKPTVSFNNHRSFHSTARNEASVKDPYATLGVKRDASAKDIKGAYYDLAKKFHPDTSKEKGAKERFVEIQSAYDILSDEKKKAAFDRLAQRMIQQEDLILSAEVVVVRQDLILSVAVLVDSEEALVDFKDFREILKMQVTSSKDYSALLEEACRGTTKNVTIAPVERCNTCEGAGLKKGAKKSTCTVCNGTGTRTFVIQSGFQMASTCPACNGAGQTIAPGDECGTCEGVGRVRSRKTVDVKIPPGVDDGAKIRMDGQGDVPLQGAGPAGSLYVRIGVRPSKVWRRQGSNLYYPATIPFHTAILGGKARVPTLDGDVDVRVPAGTQVGDEMLLRGRGVPSLMRRGDKGDLLVQFEVTIPRSLTKRQKEILQQYVDEVEGSNANKSQPSPITPPPNESSEQDEKKATDTTTQ
ncbi:hypothetical protein L7F22_019719 [Adiantum nelumboides]|nr:hypothetical protein [Adiantum nelumboides]